MKLNLPKATASGHHRHVAQALWRNARNLPTAAARVRALEQAALHAGLARALDENPDLGMARSLSESAIPDVVYCPFPPTRDAGERGDVE
jgi:hypothetical protein